MQFITRKSETSRQTIKSYLFYPLIVGHDSSGSWGMDSQWGGGGKSWGGSVSGESVVSQVGVLDDWLGAGDLDNILALDWVWVWHGVWLGHVDGGWHLDDLLDVLDDVIRDSVWLLNVDWLVDNVGLLLDLDNSWVDLLGALEGSWHGNADVWDGGLQDLGVVASNVGLLTVVNLLGDLLWGLRDAHGVDTLDVSGLVWGWQADGGWGNSCDGGSVSVGQGSGVSVGQWGSNMKGSSWSHDVGGGGAGSSNHS